MDIGSSAGSALSNTLATAQAAPPYSPPAASKKAADSVNERKEAERSDQENASNRRDAKPKDSRGPLGGHLGQSLDIAL
jgi:hypothetical protein